MEGRLGGRLVGAIVGIGCSGWWLGSVSKLLRHARCSLGSPVEFADRGKRAGGVVQAPRPAADSILLYVPVYPAVIALSAARLAIAAAPLAPEVWCNVLLENDGEVGAAVLF